MLSKGKFKKIQFTLERIKKKIKYGKEKHTL